MVPHLDWVWSLCSFCCSSLPPSSLPELLRFLNLWKDGGGPSNLTTQTHKLTDHEIRMNLILQLCISAWDCWGSSQAWSVERTPDQNLSHYLLTPTPPHTALIFLLNCSQLEAIPHQVIVILHPKLHIQWSQTILCLSLSIKVGIIIP